MRGPRRTSIEYRCNHERVLALAFDHFLTREARISDGAACDSLDFVWGHMLLTVGRGLACRESAPHRRVRQGLTTGQRLSMRATMLVTVSCDRERELRSIQKP
jgi:hypothetical protein